MKNLKSTNNNFFKAPESRLNSKKSSLDLKAHQKSLDFSPRFNDKLSPNEESSSSKVGTAFDMLPKKQDFYGGNRSPELIKRMMDDKKETIRSQTHNSVRHDQKRMGRHDKQTSNGRKQHFQGKVKFQCVGCSSTLFSNSEIAENHMNVINKSTQSVWSSVSKCSFFYVKPLEWIAKAIAKNF